MDATDELTVFVVDDDEGVRTTLALLLQTAELTVRCHASAEAFLRDCGPDPAGCLILDMRMTGMSGSQLQEELGRRGIDIPILFLTGWADMPAAIDAIKRGAVNFLAKPVPGAVLLEQVQEALRLQTQRRETRQAQRRFRDRLQRLTPRQRQILALSVSGMSNKTAAAELGVSVRTIEGYREMIYLKTGFRSVLELMNEAARVGIQPGAIISSE